MRKFLAMLLALCMVLGLMPTALAAGADPAPPAIELPAEEIAPQINVENTGETRGEARYEANDEVLAMVEITTPALIDLYDADAANGKTPGSAVSAYIQEAYASGKADELMAAQESVLDAVRALSPDNASLVPAAQWVILLNGFAVKVKYGQLEAIRALEGVERAYVAHVYTAPEPVAASAGPGGYEGNSYNMVGLADAWAEGYTGQGMVVAVLDTGLDLQYSAYWDPTVDSNVLKIRHTHEAFRDGSFKSENPAGFAAIKDEAQIMRAVNSRALHASRELLRGVPSTGFYKNLKVPYAFDYAGVVDPETYELAYGDLNVYPGDGGSDHGTHVSGTILGYAETGDGGVKFSGIAPDAQLLMMKVFDDYGYGASELSFIYALEDALTLGADVINMSYGSDNGFVDDESTGVTYYAKLERAGVILMTSAGNSGSSTYGNNYGGYSLTADPEISMMSAPAIYNSNVAVASINNTVQSVSFLNWTDGGASLDASFNDPNYEAVRYKFSDEYIEKIAEEYGVPGVEIIPAGVGNLSDFAKAGFKQEYSAGSAGRTGIALVERGGTEEGSGDPLSFADKINNATRYAWSYTGADGVRRDCGVLAVLIYDSDPNGESLITMNVANTTLTSAFVSGKTGAAMVKAANNGGAYLTHVEEEDRLAGNPTDGGQMSSFSSWGAGPGLELKPDITAPGGNIWSSVFDYLYPYSTKVGTYDDYVGGYSMMSGTSMAAPHMAGLAALVRQYVRAKGLAPAPAGGDTVTEDNITNALLVSTAVPQKETGGVYYSPRYQGAGLANVGYAVTTPAYITVEDELVGKLEFGDDYAWKGHFNGRFHVTNITGSPVAYTGKIVVQVPDTGKAANQAVDNSAGRDVMLASDRILKTIDLGTVTVEARSTATVDVDIQLTDGEIASLKALFPNGVYIEGFVVLSSDGHPDIGLPFLGYLGDWTSPAIFDAHTWLDAAGGSLWNNENTWGNSLVGYFTGYNFINLGENPFDDTVDVDTYQTVYHPGNIAIAPGTGYIQAINDFVLYQLRDARVVVLEARDAKTNELYYRDVEPFLPKTLYSDSYAAAVPMSAMYMTESWNGTKAGAARPDGTFGGSGEAIPNDTEAVFTIAAFGEGDYSGLGDTTFYGRDVTNYWAIDLADESTWPTFNGHPMDMTGDVISFPVLIDTQRPSLKNNVVSRFTDGGHTYLTGTVMDNGSLAGVKLVPQVRRIDNVSGEVDVAFVFSAPLYSHMIYDEARKEWSFTADITDYKYEDNIYHNDRFAFEWTGALLVQAMDYAGNEGDFIVGVNTGGQSESGMTLIPSCGLMYVGESFDFSVMDNSASGGLKFESADPGVASVDSAGHVVAVGSGQTVITVTNANGASEEAVIAVREHVTEVESFRLSIDNFTDMKPDGAIVVKVLDLEPANVELGTVNCTVTWAVSEDDDTAQLYEGLVTVAQYSSDLLTGEIFLNYSAGTIYDPDTNEPIEDENGPIRLAGSGTLSVTLGGTRNADGTVEGGHTETMTLNWEDLYDDIGDEDLMSDTSLDGEQTVYVTEGKAATLVTKYRGDVVHTTIPVKLYTAQGAVSPSAGNPTAQSRGLVLDGPDFAGTNSSWEGWLVPLPGYELPDRIRVFTRYTDTGYEIERQDFAWTKAFEYDKNTGRVFVAYAPPGSETELVIRADGVEKEGAPGGEVMGGTYKKPDGLYGPFQWEFVGGVAGELEPFENVTLNGISKNGAYFTASKPGVATSRRRQRSLWTASPSTPSPTPSSPCHRRLPGSTPPPRRRDGKAISWRWSLAAQIRSTWRSTPFPVRTRIRNWSGNPTTPP